MSNAVWSLRGDCVAPRPYGTRLLAGPPRGPRTSYLQQSLGFTSIMRSL